MTDLILLVKTGFINQWKFNELKNSRDKKRRTNTVLLLAVFVFLGFLIAGYAAGGALGLFHMGLESLIPTAAITIVSLITLFFTILKTNGILFGYKDYDILSSLPIKTETLVASRFIQLYLVNLAICILVMLPMGLVYGILGKKDGVFYLFWLISIAAAPLLPHHFGSSHRGDYHVHILQNETCQSSQHSTQPVISHCHSGRQHISEQHTK